MMNNKKRGKHVVLTTGEVQEIKRRVVAGESLNAISLDSAKFSTWTIRRAAAGDYDDVAIPDKCKPLSYRQVQRLLAWPTPEQAHENHEIQRNCEHRALLRWVSFTF